MILHLDVHDNKAYYPTYLCYTQTKRENKFLLPTHPEPLCYLLLTSNTHFSLLLPLLSHQSGLTGIYSTLYPHFQLSLSLLWRSITHLMKFLQENLSEVKGGEANPHCNRSFNPVHTETFVESADNPFLGHNLPHGPQDGAVRVTCDTRSLHPPPYYIQRVRRRLADETCTGSKSQAFVWVGLLAAAVLCVEEKRVRFKYCTWTAAVHRRKGTGLDQYR